MSKFEEELIELIGKYEGKISYDELISSLEIQLMSVKERDDDE